MQHICYVTPVGVTTYRLGTTVLQSCLQSNLMEAMSQLRSLLSDIPSSCQVDIKLATTGNN